VIQITLDNGERDTLITNIGAEVLEYGVFKELYYRRWGIETKYRQVKQRLELENFSGRLVDNIKQDFYAMMTVSNMLASFVREANRKAKKEREKWGNKYEYQVNVNHARGVFKDRLIGVVLEERRGRRVRLMKLMKELAREIKRRVVPIRLEREVGRKERPRKARFRACTIVCVNIQNKVEIPGGKHGYGKGTEETRTGPVGRPAGQNFQPQVELLKRDHP
jgi:hypothetical protein